ncbi:MAG: helix-turn-helix transcriptional regulator [Sphaerotilus sp.]|nr:helix-turn-helix transcriptional regulator [Sphaerotilus sp.]
MLFKILHDLTASNNPHDVLARSPSTSAGLPVAVRPIPASGFSENDHHPTACIYVAHTGTGHRRYQRGMHTLDLRTAPRMIEVYEAGLRFERAEWSGEAGRCIEVLFPDADVQALTGGELQTLPLRTAHEVFDDRVSSLALQLAEEVLAGTPSGPLYARGLSIALLAVLSAHHAGSALTRPAAGQVLAPEQRRRIIDFVAAAFGDKLTLDRLAGELRLSPFHFARLFKASFGVTPHDYVQRVRLDAAARALQRQDDCSIAEIADRCGLSSQSHLTTLMRRHLGTTPSALRRLHG